VNVIKVEHKGKKVVLKGYNSDVIGFTRSIEPLLERYIRSPHPGHRRRGQGHRLRLKALGLETVMVSRFDRPGPSDMSR
jgi:shikimate dehydrogenase